MVDEKKEEEKEEVKEAEAVSEEQAAEPVDETAAAEAPETVAEEQAAEPPVEERSPEVASASFDEIEETGTPTNVNDNIERILDIPVTVAVEVGRVRMLINDLLQLGHGSVIELEKTAGEPMEILVNDRLVAKGEVVAINEKFGIRLTDIISPMERIKQLRK
jgi:flagellar motor switch protein FliN/FliY